MSAKMMACLPVNMSLLLLKEKSYTTTIPEINQENMESIMQE